MKTETKVPIFTYKVMPTGNGDLYQWSKFDENGAVVEVSAQTFASAADAEKAARTVRSGEDRVEVTSKNNVNPGANAHVDLVIPPKAEEDRYNGMTPVTHSIEERGLPAGAADVDGEPRAERTRSTASRSDSASRATQKKVAKTQGKKPKGAQGKKTATRRR